MKKNFEGWKYTFGAVLGGVFIGLRTSPCAMRAQGWDGMGWDVEPGRCGRGD